MGLPIQHAQVDRATDYFANDQLILTIGRFSYIDGRALVYFYKEISTIRIGNFCAVARNVSFYLRANHHVEWVTTYPIDLMPWPDEVPKPEEAHAKLDGDIIIGNDVWIGEGARFLPGVTVGDGAVIGAATVVTKDVPAYSLFAGNPGAVRRMRFADADIEFLLRLQWWNWPTEKIRRFAPLICSPRIEALREETEIQGGEGGRTPTLE